MPPGVGDVPEISALWGTFVDPEVERAFVKENFAVAVQKYVRFSVTVSLVAFLAYGIHDALVIPEVRAKAWAIRFLFCGPIAAMLIAFVFKNEKPEWHQPAMLVFGLTVNSVVIWIGAISPPAGFFLYTAYAMVFVTVGPFLARMNIKTQIAYTLLTLLLYNAFDLLLTHSATMVVLSINLATFTLGGVGALAARELDLQNRLAFVQRRIIREQMAALDAERSRSETLLLNVLPRRIADRLKEAPGVVIADRFASATVLFSDIVGFTQLSTRAPGRRARAASGRGLHALRRARRPARPREDQDHRRRVHGRRRRARSRASDHAEAVCEMALACATASTTSPPSWATRSRRAHRHPHGPGRRRRHRQEEVHLRRLGRHREHREPHGVARHPASHPRLRRRRSKRRRRPSSSRAAAPSR